MEITEKPDPLIGAKCHNYVVVRFKEDMNAGVNLLSLLHSTGKHM